MDGIENEFKSEESVGLVQGKMVRAWTKIVAGVMYTRSVTCHSCVKYTMVYEELVWKKECKISHQKLYTDYLLKQ